jgi:peptide chain release factor 1
VEHIPETEQESIIIEPPEPINIYKYYCDSVFFLEPLEAMLLEKELFGLIVIDRKEATLGLLSGKRILLIKNVQSLVPSKHGRGGQSQRRFERLIEIAAHEFYVKIAGLCTDAFLNKKELKWILVAGPGATKEYFIKEGYLHHELQKKVIPTMFDVGYTDESGLKELVERASDTLTDLELAREKKLIQRLMEEIREKYTDTREIVAHFDAIQEDVVGHVDLFRKAAGGQAGHLYVEFAIAPDPRFERDGDDLLTEVPITFARAVLERREPVDAALARVAADAGAALAVDIRGRREPVSRVKTVFVRHGQAVV